ncbi:hypothetical protein F4813DRAFT_263196 [Daldinia decipiens]|uniref:uncharacterized protein n=1 Tax=Daldinia decipiens TaxID=326647 RepID=UPI0020C4E3A3|nr:uncharacterized protein F4813DRAFT_263196 [Daldinia decipiens]KAI1660762.1 hypothetical protein F4813DRAFT_263196 [Daldinia decipiens]
MTDRISSLPTQSVTPSQTVVLSPKSAPTLPNYVSNKVQGAIEEEPYTIKCICNFTDDDGNTIYCETCDTWQHIECYYPLNIDEALREDFAHSCAECKPRPLDRQGAFDRQRLRRSKPSTLEASERKVKRPPTKTTKKKARPTDIVSSGQINFDTNLKYSQDHPPTHQHKKSKSTHRPSQSISSQNPKRSPSYGQKTGNPHGHPPSPATTPPDLPHELEIQYSNAFLNLYKDDRDVPIVQTNSFASLSISNVLSLWLRDHDKLKAEAGCKFDEVFQSLPPNIDSLKTLPRIETRKLPVGPDTIVHWQHLRTSETIDKNVPLMELNGQIGIQKEYCEEPENRWQELSTPLPFVFFHPMLPIYIDTRKEGSLARYVRRSCKPNAVLDTYLSDGSEYHFWLVSDRRILPSEQITIPWEFNLQKDVARRWEQLLGLGDEEAGAQPEYDEKETETYQSIASWVHAVLSEYGGCACDLGPDCAFARFHRTYILKPQQQSKEIKGMKKKSRKTKTSAISPTSTGHATNSRAPSEGHGDDGADNDSGSSRSKPPSRDMTPAPRQGSFDTLGVLTELTDRDKRKVQMVEDSFRRMEQQQQPPRKKKRTSDGSGSSNPTSKSKPRGSFSHPGGLSNGVPERRYVDAGTTRSMSGSPSSAVSPHTIGHSKQYDPRNTSTRALARHSSQGARPEYCDVSVQTDPVDGEWFSGDCQTPKPKRRVVSLSKRLLESRHRLRADEERKRKAHSASPISISSATVKMDLDSPKVDHNLTVVPEVEKLDKPTPPRVDSPIDTSMEDAPVSPTDTKSSLVVVPVIPKLIKNKSPELRVQMPPVPAFNGTAVPSVTTALSASGTPTQSPFSSSNLPSPFAPASVNGIAVQPSPIKKKLSLSDYTKSRMNKAAAAKPAGGSLKPPSIVLEEAKSPTSSDIATMEAHVADKSAE